MSQDGPARNADPILAAAAAFGMSGRPPFRPRQPRFGQDPKITEIRSGCRPATRLGFGLINVLYVLSAVTPAWSQEDERVKTEATILFRRELLLNSHKLEPRKCSIIVDWLQNPVPESIAKSYFGSKYHASLSPVDVVPEPLKVISPAVQDSESLCYRDSASAFDKARIAEAPLGAKLFAIRLNYTFPVFDAGYSTAAVVQRYSVESFSINESDQGRSSKNAIDATDTVEVFRKKKGHWVLVKSEVIGQT